MNNLPSNIKADIQAISSIEVIPAILDVISRTTGMGFVAVARVTEEHWVTCAVLDKIDFGLKPGGELKLETTICHEIRQLRQAVVIDHVAEDKDFANHHTPALYGFQSYISIPIVLKNGDFFGTLCAIDPRPARLKNPETIGMFNLYSDLISLHLHNLDLLKQSEERLLEEKKNAGLREQFIAILGHDLRNPIGAVRNVAQLLQRGHLDEAGIKRFAGVLLNSSYRMIGLIDNVMDFARGRLGAGISLNKKQESLTDILTHVIDELQLVWPVRIIHAEFNLSQTVYCDGKRVAQLFSNLLSNALTHGDPDSPVYVTAIGNGDQFTLSVKNSGKPIPEDALKNLFEPFARGEMKQDKEGLGLGLFISAEIARVHGGKIEVRSDALETIFTFSMPV